MSSTAAHDEKSGTAYGVTIFAGVMLATLAAFELLQGFSAVLKDDVLVPGADYVYAIDVTAWGWWHVLIGVVAMVVGISILQGRWWAYSAGIGFAVLSALGQFAFLPYYPFWAMVIIAMDVLVIWALAKQLGRD